MGNFAKIGIKNFSEIWYEEFLPEKFLILIPEKIPKLILEKFWNPIPENFLSQIPEKIPIPEKFFGIGYKKFPQNWFWNNHWKVCRLGQTPDTVLCSSQEFLIGESFPGNSREYIQFLSTFSQDERFLGISADSWVFPRIFRKIVTCTEFALPFFLYYWFPVTVNLFVSLPPIKKDIKSYFKSWLYSLCLCG